MAKPRPALDIYPFTDRGQREYQEDYFYTDPPEREGQPWLGVLADGMGGHEGGDVASKEGVHAIKLAFDAAVAAGTSVGRALEESTTQGHEAVLRAAEKAGSLGNMGSTVVAFVVDGAKLHWCSAGDSRLYHFRAGRLLQLTRDFTLGEDMRQGLATGAWTQEEIDQSPRPNALTSFMGTDAWRFDSGDKPLQFGDIIVACSDGVYGTIDSEGIVGACSTAGGTARQIAENMHQRVLDVGKSNQDNCTAIVVRYGAARATAGLRTWALGAGGAVGVAALGLAVYPRLIAPTAGPPSTEARSASAPAVAAPAVAMASSGSAAVVASPAKVAAVSAPAAGKDALLGQIDKLASDFGARKVDPERAIATVDELSSKLGTSGLSASEHQAAKTTLQGVRDNAWLQSMREGIDPPKIQPTAENIRNLDGLIKRRRKDLDQLADAKSKHEATMLLAQADKSLAGMKKKPPSNDISPPARNPSPIPVPEVRGEADVAASAPTPAAAPAGQGASEPVRPTEQPVSAAPKPQASASSP